MLNQIKQTGKNFFLFSLKKIESMISKEKIVPFSPTQELKKGKGFFYKGEEFVDHSLLDLENTAFHRLNTTQSISILLGAVILIIGLILNWHLTLIIATAALTTLYFTDLLFNLYLIASSFSKPKELKISKFKIAKLKNKDWPIYTVFCPLYKEWQVLPQFIRSMSNIDYPKDKLQIMLLLEEDDQETIQKIQNMSLPPYFQIIIVPDSKPKTKPKACNYGLKYAIGKYIVIYDAEDSPDPLQLKKAVIAFEKAGKKTICIQARLNFYNPNQNILTRIFTAEYSLWFDLILSGLHSSQSLIPLGGTSNHFRTYDLQTLRGWDSFNVTEDADLGVRLVKEGYKTAIIDSITLEEANSDLGNWFKQRSRWIKGYMQTYLVHSRSLNDFKGKKGIKDFITFQLVIGGKIFSLLINPLMWCITLIYFLFRSKIGVLIESFFPSPVLYMGVMSFIFGNFLYAYYYMIGSTKHGHHNLAKFTFLTPFYWLAMSISAWIAAYELVKTPHYWAKTKHGLHLDISESAASFYKIQPKKLITGRVVPTII